MKNKLKHLIAFSLVLAISACGGGGEDNDPPAGEPPGPGPGPIVINDGVCTDVDGAVPADQDMDNDGLPDCDELSEYGTNPSLADTDGDGLNDMEEVVTFDPNSSLVRRNPLVSDLARIAIDLTSVPQIELSFTDSNQTTQSVATSHDQSVSSGTTTSRGSESSRQLAVGHTLSVGSTQTVGVEVSSSPAGLGVTGSYEASLSTGLESSQTQTTGSTVSWTAEQRQENSSTFSQAEELSNTTGTVFTGGTLRVTAAVRNDGFLAYDLENLTLSAFIFDPSRPFEMESVGNLTFTNGTFPTTSITTNSQSAPFNFSLDLSLPQARRLLRDSENLVIVPATFRLVDQQSRSLLLRDEDVSAQTAKVIIDFGVQSNRLETHRVAVNTGNGSRSMNARQALNEVLGLQLEEGLGNWIFGNEASARQTFAGVTSIAGTAMSSDRNQYWYGALNSGTADSSGSRTAQVLNLLQEGYSLGDVELRAGDTLAFVLVTDSDRDALPDRYEIEFGTNPQLVDTDGDTLGDATEIYGSDLSGPPCNLGAGSLLRSNPRLADSDGDGTDDATEIANCENPSFRVVANAGTDQIVNGGMSVTLRGQAEGSFDGQAQFSWRQMSGPPVLVNGTPTTSLEGISPTFTAPMEVSTLIFTLDVDVDGSTSSDQVIVQVQRDRSAAVYVGNTNGGNEDGSINAPFGTLQRAISSLSTGEDLYVMTLVENGEPQPYSLVSSLEIPDGTDMYGGFDSNWVRNVDAQRTPVTLSASVDNQGVFSYSSISGSMELSGFALTSLPGTTSASDSLVALLVTANGSGSLIVENNTLTSSDVNASPVAVPGSSYGARITDLARLDFRNNQVIAGNGGIGANGSRGNNGIRGENGSNGNGQAGGSGGNDNRGGQDGGGGGRGGGILGGGGSDGADGRGSGGGNGGTASGGAGSLGSAGVAGRNGSPAGLFGSASGEFVPAAGNSGTRGVSGNGGGGGAGAQGIATIQGGGGGGGGQGGTFSEPGEAGAGGGASIGVWLSALNDSLIRGNTIVAANGGNAGSGGTGGTPGSGGSGGSGGVVTDFLGGTGNRGGSGGNGGRGGRGGDGSGGSGGPSIGIFVGANLSPFIEDNGISTGQGGNAGARGNSGDGGDSVGIYDANLGDGAVPVNVDNRFTIGMPGSSNSPSNGGAGGSDGCAGEVNCR